MSDKCQKETEKRYKELDKEIKSIFRKNNKKRCFALAGKKIDEFYREEGLDENDLIMRKFELFNCNKFWEIILIPIIISIALTCLINEGVIRVYSTMSNSIASFSQEADALIEEATQENDIDSANHFKRLKEKTLPPVKVLYVLAFILFLFAVWKIFGLGRDIYILAGRYPFIREYELSIIELKLKELSEHNLEAEAYLTLEDDLHELRYRLVRVVDKKENKN